MFFELVKLFHEAIVSHCYEIASKFKQLVYDSMENEPDIDFVDDKFRSVSFSMHYKSIFIVQYTYYCIVLYHIRNHHHPSSTCLADGTLHYLLSNE